MESIDQIRSLHADGKIDCMKWILALRHAVGVCDQDRVFQLWDICSQDRDSDVAAHIATAGVCTFVPYVSATGYRAILEHMISLVPEVAHYGGCMLLDNIATMDTDGERLVLRWFLDTYSIDPRASPCILSRACAETTGAILSHHTLHNHIWLDACNGRVFRLHDDVAKCAVLVRTGEPKNLASFLGFCVDGLWCESTRISVMMVKHPTDEHQISPVFHLDNKPYPAHLLSDDSAEEVSFYQRRCMSIAYDVCRPAGSAQTVNSIPIPRFIADAWPLMKQAKKSARSAMVL